MDDDHVRSLVATLDAAVPRDGAVIHAVPCGEIPYGQGAGLSGNRAGFLRLGIALLQAAWAPGEQVTESGSVQGHLDLTPLAFPPDEFAVTAFERWEQPPPPTPEPSRADRIMGSVIGLLGFIAYSALIFRSCRG